MRIIVSIILSLISAVMVYNGYYLSLTGLSSFLMGALCIAIIALLVMAWVVSNGIKSINIRRIVRAIVVLALIIPALYIYYNSFSYQPIHGRTYFSK